VGFNIDCDDIRRMSVIVELSLPADQFELGRILPISGDSSIVLETMVPLGERSVPFFRLQDGRKAFEETVREHPSVEEIQVVHAHDSETLYAIDWTIGENTFVDALISMDAHLLEATGTTDIWRFELRFPSHERLSDFQEYCADVGISLEIRRVYNPTRPDAGPWFGLTAPQRAVIERAVEAGYYAIPRETSTATLAEEFDISDQAVTERLRRAIMTLVANTLLLSDDEDAK